MMALMLTISGEWKGPLLLLAPAQKLVAMKAKIPLHLIAPPSDYVWPIRIVHGIKDTTVPVSHSEELAEAANNSHLTIVDDTHALNNWLKQDDHFLQVVDQLLGLQ